MHIKPFKIERYFALYEFSAPYLLSCSDPESFSLSELLSIADIDSLERWENLSLGYTESRGLPALRATITSLYTTVTADDLIVLAPIEGIFVAMNALLEKGDHVISIMPAYQSLYEVAKTIGCTVSPWQVKRNETKWYVNIDELESLVRPNTKLLTFNFPHNPTGLLPTHEEFEKIMAFARKHNLYVFSDEMYRYSEYNEANRLPSATDVYDKAVSLCGMSKTFALPGLRIGWLATKDQDLLNRIATLKDYTTICSSAPSEVLALMGVRAVEKIRKRNLAIIKKNLEVAQHFFDKHEGLFSWVRPNAGTICFPQLNLKQSIEEVATELVETKGAMILPSSVFEYSGNNFRLGLGRKNLAEGLEKFSEYIDERLR